jgi:hypothetical protein
VGEEIPVAFYIEEPTVEAVAELQALVHDLNSAREWTAGTVAFVNEVDADSITQPEDEPIWSLGGTLWLDEPSRDSHDRKQLEDVSFLISRLCGFSAATGYDLVVEYNREAVGWIENGRADRGLTEVLLREWDIGLGEH